MSTTKEELLALLRSGPRTHAELYEELPGHSQNTIRGCLSRLRQEGLISTKITLEVPPGDLEALAKVLDERHKLPCVHPVPARVDWPVGEQTVMRAVRCDVLCRGDGGQVIIHGRYPDDMCAAPTTLDPDCGTMRVGSVEVWLPLDDQDDRSRTPAL